jgi:hypothetical protein
MCPVDLISNSLRYRNMPTMLRQGHKTSDGAFSRGERQSAPLTKTRRAHAVTSSRSAGGIEARFLIAGCQVGAGRCREKNPSGPGEPISIAPKRRWRLAGFYLAKLGRAPATAGWAVAERRRAKP